MSAFVIVEIEVRDPEAYETQWLRLLQRVV